MNIELANRIRKWDICKDGVINFITYISDVWVHQYGTMKTSDDFTTMELHTGGWSENEEVIHFMEQSMFWRVFWWKSERGGHYYFKDIKELPKLTEL